MGSGIRMGSQHLPMQSLPLTVLNILSHCLLLGRLLGQMQPKIGDCRRVCHEEWQDCLPSNKFRIGEEGEVVQKFYLHICHNTLVILDWTVALECVHFLRANFVFGADIMSMVAGGQGIYRVGISFFVTSIETRMVHQEIFKLIAVRI